MNETVFYEKIPPNPQIRLQRFPPRNYDFYLHWHEQTEIHLLLEGSGRLKCAGGCWDVTAGDVVVINSCEIHEGGGGQASYYCLHIPTSFFQTEHSIFTKVIRDAYLSDLMNRIYERCSSESAADHIALQGYTCLFVAHLMQHYTEQSLSEAAYARYTGKRNKVNAAIEIIGQRYDQPLSTRHLADQLYLSEGYFCKIFKEVTGRTVTDFINRYRIDKAEGLLAHTDLTVTEVALWCGVSDVNYFAQLYKKIKGCPPSTGRNLR